jgi:hypothetical protein
MARELDAARERITGLSEALARAEETRTDQARTDPADREAIVAELAADIRDAIDAGDRWHPDYQALMERTGFRRSWCEKAVRDARTAAAFPVRTDETRTETRTGDLALANGHAPGRRQ